MEWLNYIVPYLRLPKDASEEEIRGCLIDGTVLCRILNKLCPGSVEMVGMFVFLWLVNMLLNNVLLLYDCQNIFMVLYGFYPPFREGVQSLVLQMSKGFWCLWRSWDSLHLSFWT